HIPTAATSDGKVRVKVIAGAALGVEAVIEPRTPIVYQHFSLEPGASIVQPVASSYRVFAYPLSGTGRYGNEQIEIGAQHMVIFGDDGDAVTLTAGSEPLD